MKTIGGLAMLFFGLMIGSASADDPKSFGVTLKGGRVGSIDLPAGEYRLLIHRDQMVAQLQSVKNGDIIDLDAKVESVESKYDRTEIHTRQQGETSQLTEIHIGGTRFRIVFEKSS